MFREFPFGLFTVIHHPFPSTGCMGYDPIMYTPGAVFCDNPPPMARFPAGQLISIVAVAFGPAGAVCADVTCTIPIEANVGA